MKRFENEWLVCLALFSALAFAFSFGMAAGMHYFPVVGVDYPNSVIRVNGQRYVLDCFIGRQEGKDPIVVCEEQP